MWSHITYSISRFKNHIADPFLYPRSHVTPLMPQSLEHSAFFMFALAEVWALDAKLHTPYSISHPKIHIAHALSKPKSHIIPLTPVDTNPFKLGWHCLQFSRLSKTIDTLVYTLLRLASFIVGGAIFYLCEAGHNCHQCWLQRGILFIYHVSNTSEL